MDPNGRVDNSGWQSVKYHLAAVTTRELEKLVRKVRGHGQCLFTQIGADKQMTYTVADALVTSLHSARKSSSNWAWVATGSWEDRFAWQKVARPMEEVYDWMIGSGDPAACVALA